MPLGNTTGTGTATSEGARAGLPWPFMNGTEGRKARATSTSAGGVASVVVAARN